MRLLIILIVLASTAYAGENRLVSVSFKPFPEDNFKVVYIGGSVYIYAPSTHRALKNQGKAREESLPTESYKEEIVEAQRRANIAEEAVDQINSDILRAREEIRNSAAEIEQSRARLVAVKNISGRQRKVNIEIAETNIRIAETNLQRDLDLLDKLNRRLKNAEKDKDRTDDILKNIKRQIK